MSRRVDEDEPRLASRRRALGRRADVDGRLGRRLRGLAEHRVELRIGVVAEQHRVPAKIRGAPANTEEQDEPGRARSRAADPPYDVRPRRIEQPRVEHRRVDPADHHVRGHRGAVRQPHAVDPAR